MTPEFLTLEDVLTIHQIQIARFGGSPGLRDRGLLESAVAQPQMTFGDDFLHEDLFAMASAYLFHLVSNHAFVDGNKRVGLAAALVFLDINGLPIRQHTSAFYELTMATARSELEKPEIAIRLREIAEL
jgi:death-on-curing protein